VKAFAAVIGAGGAVQAPCPGLTVTTASSGRQSSVALSA
jgi:hypothetical protein